MWRSAACAWAILMWGCASALRPFPPRPIVWLDDDQRAFAPRPQRRDSSALWDTTDALFLRPVTRTLNVEGPREAVDVNALDEVPSSSFFENRIGRFPMSPAEVAQAACREPPVLPLTAIEAKPEGVQPGVIVRDARGQRYMLKIDAAEQPELATAAEAVVAALHHAIGYRAPCNRVVFLARSDVRYGSGPDAPRPADVDRVMNAAVHTRDGQLRVLLSEFIEGQPLGPWSYSGVWNDDRNDRVPHELRRELRALVVVSAWVSHVDARPHNTLAAWIPSSGERGHVRHYLIDFGDSIGSVVAAPRRIGRAGHTSWFDAGTVTEDVLTLGLLPRPWYRNPRGGAFGRFDARFDPDAWRANHGNLAYELADESDRAWMARIIARLSDAHLRAIAELGRFSSAQTTRELTRILAARRDSILERYLTRLSPLTQPHVLEGRLCLEDRLRTSGLRRYRRYAAQLYGTSGALPVRATADGVCVEVPLRSYVVVDVRAWTRGRDRPAPVRVHLRTEGGELRVAGLERPS